MKGQPQDCDSSGRLTRRGFLRVGGLGALALGLHPGAETAEGSDEHAGGSASGGRARACLFIVLTGGPSQLDTFDPRPDAPQEVRGPFGAVRTTVPGLWFSESLPRLARLAHRLTLIRTVQHDQLSTHEAGLQYLLSGGLHRGGLQRPGLGAMLCYLDLCRHQLLRPWFVLPRPLGNLGLSMRKGQDAGPLGPLFEPFGTDPHERSTGAESVRIGIDEIDRLTAALDLSEYRASVRSLLQSAAKVDDEPESVRERYGQSGFARNLLTARRLIERGASFVVVNMFTELFGTVSWDCHANTVNLTTTLEDYRRTVCPTFDRAFSALIEDLEQRGLLSETLVVAAGEMGRSYLLNHRGGRDHWTRAWTVVMAGAGLPEGAVIGRTDQYAAEPEDRPVHVADVAATICRLLGYAPATSVTLPQGRFIPLAEGHPIAELVDTGTRVRV